MTDIRRYFLRKPLFFLAFGFGSGFAPKAPGTFATLVAIPFHLVFINFPPWLHGTIISLAFILGIWICGKTADFLGVHDHEGIVWDEFVGYWVTMFLLPVNWLWIILGFIVFRILDILKPWPIKLIDSKVPGGAGIMLDDLAAGIMGAAFLNALLVLNNWSSL
tara:strand:+ start:20 stop:508 length:489 start_codon:yes stop_codon:yes gene_type:complete